MSPVVEKLLTMAAELGPDIAEGVLDLIREKRPELVASDPPERQDEAIQAEDEDIIAKRFHSSR